VFCAALKIQRLPARAATQHPLPWLIFEASVTELRPSDQCDRDVLVHEFHVNAIETESYRL
jgi:hypothetical protein